MPRPTFDFSADSVAWVFDRGALTRLTDAIQSCDEVVIDLETTGLHEHAVTGGSVNGGVSARIALASITLPQADDADPMKPTTWVLPLSHPDSPFSGSWRVVMRKVAQAIKDGGAPICNHNMKFDARWIFATTGVDISRQIEWDTQLSSHLLDENSSTKLKERAPDRFGVTRWDDFDLKYPGAAEDVPLFDLGLYAARDTYWTWALEQAHKYQMNLPSVYGPGGDAPEDLDEALDMQLGALATKAVMPMVRTLTAIEQRGILLDTEWVHEKLKTYLDEADELFSDLASRYDFTGTENEGRDPSFAPTSIYFKAWAQRAVEEGDLQIVSMTKSGNPQWTGPVLKKLVRKDFELADTLLTYRGNVKKAEFLRSWLKEVSRRGTIHSTYNAGSVITGRLSSSGPNMQQVTKALKPAFVPHEGYVLAELDYSQIELRVAAFISRCEPMITAFQGGADLHTLLASRITGKDPADVTPTERQAGKSANFGLLYGMGPKGFREYAESVYGVALTEEEALTIHSAFFETWDGIGAWHIRAIEHARNYGHVVSPIGRVRRLPEIWDSYEETAAAAERAAINAPVQGFASDLMQMAASSIEGTLPYAAMTPVGGARLVGTVHDSILVEVRADDWEAIVRTCQDRMQDVGNYVRGAFGVDFDVPLISDATVGTRWGTGDLLKG